MKKNLLTLAFALISALAVSAAFGQTTADEWYTKAGEYFVSGDHASAITAYSETIKRDSSNLDAYWFRGFAYYQIKNYDAAIADFNTVIKGAPDYPDAYIVRGDAYGAKGAYHTAIADYKTGLEKGYDPGGFTIDKSSKADMWFCGAMFMEITVNRFLGKSDVAAKYENWLKTVCDKSGLTRAEVEAFYRQNIGTLVAQTVDAEFRDITIAASRKTSIKQTLTAFFVNPNQTTYNGLKLYKYPNGTKHSLMLTESAIVGDLHNAETFDRQGMKGAAQAARDSAKAAQDLANTMKTANAYITAIRALNDSLADRILQDSR